MTENLILSSWGLALSPSLVFLSTELSAVVTMVASLHLHAAALSSVCGSFRGRGPSLMASQKKKVVGGFSIFKAAVAGSDSGAGHPRVRSKDYSFVSPRSAVVCICRDWSGHILFPRPLSLAAFRPALCLVTVLILRPSGDEHTCSPSPHPPLPPPCSPQSSWCLQPWVARQLCRGIRVCYTCGLRACMSYVWYIHNALSTYIYMCIICVHMQCLCMLCVLCMCRVLLV